MKAYKYITMAMAVLVLFVAVQVIAGTQDKTVGGTTGYPGTMIGKTVLLERTIDFSLSANTGTAADIYQLLNIPANSFVLKVGYKLEANANGYTGEDGTETIDIGDGNDPDGYFDGSNVETGQTASATTIWSPGTTSYSSVTGQPTLVTSTITNVVPTFFSGGTGTNYVSSAITNTYVSVIGVTNNTVTTYPITSAPRPYAQGVMYTSADTIDMILNNNADQLKITVRALVIPVGGL